jgi:urease accessory protein
MDKLDRVGPPAPRRRVRVEGGARVRLRDDDGVSRLAELWHHDPMRVLCPTPVDDLLPHVVLLNTAGGLVGGDALDVEIRVDARARALVTGQAAEKVYRSDGPAVTITNRLAVGEEGWLEWMPQEAILFDRARLQRRLSIDLAAGARCIAGEMIVFGRAAHGETISGGLLHDRWEIRAGGRLVWAESLRLDEMSTAALRAPFAVGGARALATLVYAGPDAAALLAPVREALAAGLGDTQAGMAATCLGGMLLARGVAEDPRTLRRGMAACWRLLRAQAGNLPPLLPRLWHI